jgi:uncharacterized membrane protein YhaH (DUF805 family)
MNFGEAVSTCFSKYVDFSGRAPRSEYWWFALFLLLLNIVAAVIDVLVFGAADGLGIVSIVLGLATLLPSIAVGVRRLHDIDRTGWWYLIIFIPIIGAIVLIIFFVLAGTSGDNNYGPDPLAPGA